MSRYLTYILLSLITVYIAMQKKFPKTRRTFGLISLQFVLLITTQIIYHFQKGAASEREPVLSYVYKAYEHSHFPVWWGLIGFYLLKIFIPLISIAGVIILTLILLSSSIILLLKLRHRDVVKASIDKMRNSSQSASSNFKVKREQNRLKKERQREKKKSVNA